MATKEEVISVEGDYVKDGISGSVDVSLIVKTNFGPIRRKNYQRRKVVCKICSKSMQANNLKRHMKQHSDLMSMDEDEA